MTSSKSMSLKNEMLDFFYETMANFSWFAA